MDGREGGELILAQCRSTYIDQSQLFYLALWYLSLMRHITNLALSYEENMHNFVSQVEADKNYPMLVNVDCNDRAIMSHSRRGV